MLSLVWLIAVVLPEGEALSYFTPEGNSLCHWQRLSLNEPPASLPASLPTSNGELLTTLPAACAGVRVALSSNHKRALVWLDPSFAKSELPGMHTALKEPPRPTVGHLWLVHLDDGPFVSGFLETIALPDYGRVIDLGFDTEDHPVALTLKTEPVKRDQHGAFFRVEGERIGAIADDEGSPIVASAFRYSEAPLVAHERAAHERKPSTWQRFETQATSEDADYSRGVSVLQAEKTLGFRSATRTQPSLTSAEGEQVVKLAKPAASFPGDWFSIGDPGHSDWLAWAITGDENHLTGLVFRLQEQQWVPLSLPSYTATDLIAFEKHPGLLLISTTVGSHPRLFDSSGALRFQSDVAEGSFLWPSR